jgi:glycosidase
LLSFFIQVRKDPASLLNCYRALLRLRREHAALRRGDLTLLAGTPRSILAYRRASEEETLLIVLNFSDRKQRFAHRELRLNRWDLLFSSHSGERALPKEGRLVLAGNQAVILMGK